MRPMSEVQAECRVLYENYIPLVERAGSYDEASRLLKEMNEAARKVWDRELNVRQADK